MNSRNRCADAECFDMYDDLGLGQYQCKTCAPGTIRFPSGNCDDSYKCMNEFITIAGEVHCACELD
jgi:hypothetical protein